MGVLIFLVPEGMPWNLAHQISVDQTRYCGAEIEAHLHFLRIRLRGAGLDLSMSQIQCMILDIAHGLPLSFPRMLFFFDTEMSNVGYEGDSKRCASPV